MCSIIAVTFGLGLTGLTGSAVVWSETHSARHGPCAFATEATLHDNTTVNNRGHATRQHNRQQQRTSPHNDKVLRAGGTADGAEHLGSTCPPWPTHGRLTSSPHTPHRSRRSSCFFLENGKSKIDHGGVVGTVFRDLTEEGAKLHLNTVTLHLAYCLTSRPYAGPLIEAPLSPSTHRPSRASSQDA
ncbi:unnamed protein product [Lota lota]